VWVSAARRFRVVMTTVTRAVISAIIVGLIIGALGRWCFPAGRPSRSGSRSSLASLAAIVGTLIANALDVGTTSGIDWIELLIQIALAAIGVALVAGMYAPGRRRI
jgi:hypothetical protein